MGNGIVRLTKRITNSLFGYLNRQFFIFLFFLFLSGIFWSLLTLNESYERDIPVLVKVVDYPKKVIITSDVVDTVRVSIKDKGYALLAYLYGDALPVVTVDFKTHANDGKCIVTAAEIQKVLRQQLYTSSKISGVKPSQLEFYYNYGEKKYLPVQLNGEIRPMRSYSIMKVTFEPDKVVAYASEEKLAELQNAVTTNVSLLDVKDTIVENISLEKIAGVKFVPSKVKMSVYPDVLTEEALEIPVTTINVPDGKSLRMFPARVKVSFTVPASQFRRIHPIQFTVVADYQDIAAHPTEKCTLKIKEVPDEVKNVRLEQPQVDYLVENQ